MYEVRVYGRNRDIPWNDTHICLRAGAPVRMDDEAMVEHIRKFDNPANGRGIEIVEIDAKPKSVRSMSLDELRAFATEKGVDFDDSDSRNAIMKKLRGEK